uniref:Uncharacterized protein n=1 Tax=Clastoptera arizonana TaxID=38151 RepID=A0A1B6BZE1_9HEMI
MFVESTKLESTEEINENISEQIDVPIDFKLQDELENSTFLCKDSSESGEDKLTLPQPATDINENHIQKHRKRRRSTESKLSHNSITSNKLKSLKLLVDRAVEHNKTFAILGKFPSIREALKARGWVQNYEALTQYKNTSSYSNNSRQNHHKEVEAPSSSSSDQCVKMVVSNEDQDAQLISRLLRDAPVNFIWAMGDYIDWKYISKLTVVSRFPRVYFTTKVGLCNYLQQTHWFCEAGISNTLFPRCYNIASEDDLEAFINNFRLTACISTLQIVINAIDNDNKDIYSEEGKLEDVQSTFLHKSMRILMSKNLNTSGTTSGISFSHGTITWLMRKPTLLLLLILKKKLFTCVAN